MKKFSLSVFSITFLTTLSACGGTTLTSSNSVVDTDEGFFGTKTAAEWAGYYSDKIGIDNDHNSVLDWQETEMTIVYASDFYEDEDSFNTLFRTAMKWAAQYPNITLVRDQRFKKAVTADDDYLAFQMYVAASQEGTMPDIYYSPLSAEVYDQDLTLDLTPYLRSDEDARFIRENSLAFITSADGLEIWGVPYMSVSQFPAVNVGLLNQLNIPIPSYDWTYAEYEELREAIAVHTKAGSCAFPGIIDYSVVGPNYFDSIPNGWNGFNSETQRFDFASAINFGEWLTMEAQEGDEGLHFADLPVEEQTAKCGSYTWAWGDGFQAIDNVWMFALSTDVNNLIKTRGLDIDMYPMPTSPDGGQTALHGYYDAFSLSYELKDDPIKAEAVYDLAKWLTYDVDGTKARWDLIDEDIAAFGYNSEEWVANGHDAADFPIYHVSTNLMDYVMGWPVTTNTEVLENHPLVVGFPEDSPFNIYNFEAFKNPTFQSQLANPVAYPRQIPAAATAILQVNVWNDIKERIRKEGYSYGSLAAELDDLMNEILDEYLANYTK